MSRRLALCLLFLDIILIVLVIAAAYYFEPSVVIVPHHDLVKAERCKVLAAVARRRPQTKTIVLLSPDHFNPNQRLITSSTENFTTAEGSLNYDPTIGAYFAPEVINNPTAVKNDHGIFALLKDLKTNFPKSLVVPILLGQALNPTDLKSISKTINQTCLSDCLLLASVDFSHYLPATLANIHDAYSLKTLSNLNLDSVMSLEVDSPQSLYLALSHAPPRFVLAKHTNSGEMLQNYDIETTSHVMGWYQRGKPSTINNQTFLFARDLILNPHQKTVGDRFFYGADLTDTALSSSQFPAPNLKIIPISSSVSTLNLEGGVLQVNLGSDLAVAGTINPQGSWSLVLLPLTGVGQDRLLARGQIKAAALNRLLEGISSPYTLNSATGTITYPK